MRAYLALALGLVRLLNWATAYLDAKERERVVRAIVDSEEIGRDVKAASAAAAVVRDVAAELDKDPSKITAPDEDMKRP